MFHCGLCGRQSDPGEKQKKVVVVKRPMTYTKKDGSPSYGWEIAREIPLGDCCKVKEVEVGVR
jgi:hypothetical protein